MYELSGEYECRVDAKGRLKLPSALLRQFMDEDSSFMLNRGFEKCLILYPKDVWDTKTKELNQLNTFIAKNRKLVRMFYRGATVVETDATDRIRIPQILKDYAGIEKDLVLMGLQSHVELWSRDEYLKMIQSDSDSLSDLADDVFGNED